MVIKTAKTSFPSRLHRAIQVWQKMNEPMLEHRKKMLQYYASGYYAKGEQKSHPINLTDRGIGIVVPYLVMGNPAVLVNTKIASLQPWAYTTQLALMHLLDEIDFATSSLRPAVRNSMYGAGITKTGIMHAEEVEYAGYLHDLGQPYCDIIDDSDYVGDPTARSREDFEFEGNFYLMPTDYAKEFFGPKYADDISVDYKLYGDAAPQTLAGDVSSSDFHTVKKWSRFCDLWLPKEDVIITITPPDKNARILRTVEWDGPEGGPYDVLGYKYFPNSPVPIPPVWGWLDMDTMMNVMVLKARHQAEREKIVLAYEASAADDAERISSTPDGGTVKVENIDRIKEVKYGGVNPDIYSWVQYVEAQFSRQYGNLYVTGGRETQAGTLGQEQMLQANATRILEDMAIAVHNHAKSVFRKMAWFFWTDPLIRLPVIKRVPGTAGLDVIFSQQAKEGDFWDFNFDIEPYSMQRLSPEIRYQRFLTLLNQWLLPSSQLAAAQGNQLQIDVITRQLAMYLDVKNVDEWWKSASPKDVGINPYQPMSGVVKVKSGQSDGRTGMMGAASRQANMSQQQARAGGQSSKEV